jgi:propanol-preferring alcohol dehydrogenase
MLSARIHDYQKPLTIENIEKPVITKGEQVLVKVGATGLCHSDLHLINGDWKNSIPLQLPTTSGHEIAGWVEEVGDFVPKDILNKEDMVAVFGGWGCGVCVYCKNGDEQMCNFARWPGIMTNGGFAEYVLVDSYRFLVNIQKSENNNNEKYEGSSKLKIEEIAPLTDAGLTPYRAIKKVRNLLGPGKNIAVIGIGGLGHYAIQYAKTLGQSANVIALDKKDEKLQLAKRMGADFTINMSSSSKGKYHERDQQQQQLQRAGGIRQEILEITKGKGVNVVIDCVGAENTVYDSIRLLSKGGVLVLVGLFGSQIKMPLVQFVIGEYSVMGSLWGNYNELCEVIELAKTSGKLKHSIHKFSLEDINEAILLLKEGKIEGRAVIVP